MRTLVLAALLTTVVPGVLCAHERALSNGPGFAAQEMVRRLPPVVPPGDQATGPQPGLRPWTEQDTAMLDHQVQPASMPAPPALLPGAAVAAVPDDTSADAPQYVTKEELESSLKKWSWRKGDVKIVPYGTVWGSASYDSQRTRPGDYALWVESPTTHPDDPGFAVDARSSRFGVDLSGPGIPWLCNAPVSGKVEIDFQGYYLTRNKPGLMLRHAYVEAKNEEFRVLVGQTWDVISPLYIPTLNYTAGSAVGNLAYRRAQFRLERYFDRSDQLLVTWQGSINANVVTDYVSDTSVSADIGPYPDVQSRVAFTLGDRAGPEARPVVLGFSGHIGQQNFDFRNPAELDLDLDRRTWSLNADLVLPITKKIGVQAEFFTGENLSNYMGGILQGVDRNTHHTIRSTGGFLDLYCDWRPDLHTHAGWALDDPLDSEITTASGRLYNQMLYTNVLWEATKNLQLGLEADVWKTTYVALAPGDAVRIEFVTRYRF